MEKQYAKNKIYRRRNIVIRKILEELVEDLKMDEVKRDLLPGLDLITKPNVPICLKFVWFLIFGLSSSFCILLVYQSVDYFMSVPVAVDVTFSENSTILKEINPQLTICNQITPQIMQLKPLKDYYYAWEFLNLLDGLIHKQADHLENLWEFTDFTNSNVSIRVVLINRTKIDLLPTKKINHPMGKCSVFQIDEIANIKNAFLLNLEFYSAGSAQFTRSILGNFKSLSQLWDNKNTWSLRLGSIAGIPIQIRKYTSLKTPQNLCVDNYQYGQCASKCFVKQLKLNYNCSFPFFPEELNMPLCEPKEAKDLYMKAFSLYYEFNPHEECNCPKSCERIVFQFAPNICYGTDQHTNIYIELTRISTTYITQRYTFYFIDLLCSIGGNIVLFLNLCVLSLFQLFGIFFSVNCKKKKQMKTQSLCNKIGILFRLEENFKMKTLERKSKLTISNMLLTFVIASCVLVSSYHIFTLVKRYTSYPITTIIDVTENKTVYYPRVILCSKNFITPVIRPNLAKSIGKEHCKVEFEDGLKWIFKIFKYTLGVFWKNRYIKTMIRSVSEKYGPLKFTPNVTLDYVETHLGLCAQLQIESQQYGGTYTFAMIISELLNPCKDNYQIFLATSSQQLQPYSHHEIPYGGLALISLEAIGIQRLNHPKNPCTSSEINDACLDQCIKSLLLKNLDCRFLFMQNFSLPPCEYSYNNITRIYDKITNAYKMYNIITSKMIPSFMKRCNCFRKCNDTLHNTHIYTNPAPDAPLTALFIAYRHNLIQHFIEIWSYNIDVLMSDIGSALGLTLGVSIISFFSVCNYSVTAVKLHCLKKKK